MKHAESEHKNYIYWILAILKTAVIIAVIYFVFFFHHVVDFTGTGSVNLFPDGAAAKNYRLNASVRVQSSSYGVFGEKTTIYIINKVQWPNGGSSRFNNCVLSYNTAECTDQDNKKYSVELEKAPTE